MCKRVLIILLCSVLLACCTMLQVASMTLNDLRSCKHIAACGNNAAYFYGYTNTSLVSVRVSDEYRTSCVYIDGVIRAATHSGCFTYALVSVSRSNYNVIRLNADNGTYDVISLHTDSAIDSESIAANNREVFLLSSNGVYRSVISFDFDGYMQHSYSLSLGAVCLFSNGTDAYALAGTGDIFRFSGEKTVYCAAVAHHAQISDAGEGTIHADGKLVSLNNGNTIPCDSKLAAMGANGVVTSDTGLLLTTAEAKTFLLNNDYSCTTSEQKTHIVYNDSSSARHAEQPLTFYVGTTIEQLKKMFPDIQTVTDADGNEVSSGKLRTNYRTGSFCIIVLGDLDGSGTLSSRDTKAMLRHQVGSQSLRGAFLEAADFNRDGNTDNRDLLLMAKHT